MIVESHLRFALPSEDEARYLYETEEAYVEYITFDAFMGAYLAYFVPVYSRPDSTLEEAMSHIEAAIHHPTLQPVRVYLEAIRATLIRLKAEYEIDADTGKKLMRRYLDDSLALSARFSHALREQDFEIVRAYLSE